MAFLILLRHGKSVWNEKNLFTGWVDIPLSSIGINEALKAGQAIQNLPIDIIYTSNLIRSQMTALLAMSSHSSGKTPLVIHDAPEDIKEQHMYSFQSEQEEQHMIPLYKSRALNERMYGELQGKNKKQTADLYGEEQVKLWRRSYDIAPPKGESLLNTKERTIPFFNSTIVPLLQNSKNVFVAAHGNSLRAIIMDIEKLSKEDVISLEIPTGQPIVYLWENNQYKKQTL